MSTLILAEVATHDRGGVELLFERMFRESSGQQLEVLTMDRREALGYVNGRREARSVTVFVQEEGGLSRSYRSWAESILATGSSLVELNIFALESRHRPIHRSYSMGLLTEDGAHRYVLRSFLSGAPRQRTWVPLPNPMLQPPAVDGEREETRARLGCDPSDLVLLRVGRPDPRKWTSFEVKVAATAAADRARVVLILVGAPDDLVRATAGAARVVNIPAGPDVAQYYAAADVYVHQSRIGETFGNTIAEAKAAGLPIFLGVDPAWDTGCLTLADATDVVGSPEWCLANTALLFDLRRSPGSHIEGRSVGEFARRVVDAGGYLVPTPSVADAFRHLRGVHAMLSTPPRAVYKSLVREAGRAWRRGRM